VVGSGKPHADGRYMVSLAQRLRDFLSLGRFIQPKSSRMRFLTKGSHPAINLR
jgi:hypothetical protein